MVIAVLMLAIGIITAVCRIVESVNLKKNYSMVPQIIMITIGLSYLIWYCN